LTLSAGFHIMNSVKCNSLETLQYDIKLIMPEPSSLLNRIKSNALFESVDENLLRKILDALSEVSMPDGKLIFDEGDEGHCLYLLLSGVVRISKKLKSGQEIVLGLLQSGDFFGELDLIDERLRSGRAVASGGVGGCTLARLAKPEFDILMRESPPFARNLLKGISLRLRASNLTYVYSEESNLIALSLQLEKMHKLVDASKIVNSSLDIDQLLRLILETATRTVSADRGTLYILDDLKNELWSKVQQGSTVVEIRLPVGRGIAGFVASSGEIINISDAYNDQRFNPEIDKTTGYRTKTILCMPMKNKEGKIIGVFQLLNKAGGSFTKEDEEFIEGLSVHASIAIENAAIAQKMMHNERLSTVGRMASSIIHDIKNPLGTLRLSMQLMKKKAGDRETSNLADSMVRQIDQFIAMTQEILDFVRGVSSLNIQKVQFQELTETAIPVIKEDLEKRNIRFVSNIKFAGFIDADPEKLFRAFYNICNNAADAMPMGGSLTVNASESDGRLLVEFIDTGTGIPPEVKAKIFEPFFTYGKKHGTGLGMAIVKKIVEDHRGKIEIESEMGKGTRVCLFIPIHVQ